MFHVKNGLPKKKFLRKEGLFSMAYKYKEYNFNDCTITRVGDSLYIDIGKNKDIIPYIAEFISDKIKDVTEIVIDYISDRYNRKNQK